MPIRARLRGKSQITLPAEVREALHVEPGDEVEFEFSSPGEVRILGLKTIRSDQAWFWAPEWQAGEREATGERDRGEGEVYRSAEEMFSALGGEE
jgi:AbrB family looped-hinge helix DNA binding protein